MTPDWGPLRAELALWRREGRALPLWWRDDDAVAATPALERLARLSEDLGLPVHVAVIPALAEPSLRQMPTHLVPVVHGWQHLSHAPAGAKKAEFGHPRATAQADVKAGLARLQTLFGARLLPLFVPPWNRIDASVLPLLAEAGYRGVSTFGARHAAFAAPGLRQVNTHIDPVFWRGDRGLAPVDLLLDGVVGTLRDRREGRADGTEPLGLLTHHLVHTEAVWEFSRALLRELLEGGAASASPL